MGTMLDTASNPVTTFAGLKFDSFGAYVSGKYKNYDAAHQAYPRLNSIQIDCIGLGIGTCGDFESGCMTIDHAGMWAKARLNAGVWKPVIYFSISQWASIMESLKGAGIARGPVRIWSAHYNGKQHLCSKACNAAVTGTADATQWASPIAPGTLPPAYAHRNVDVSMTGAAFWGAPLTAPQFERVLKLGSTGHAVELWQHQMQLRGWHVLTHGNFDATCQTVCKSFQKEKGLKVTGRVDKLTWNATWIEPITA